MRKILTLMLLSLLMGACNKDDVEQQPTPKPNQGSIVITATNAIQQAVKSETLSLNGWECKDWNTPTTRSVLGDNNVVYWSYGDSIGVYSDKAVITDGGTTIANDVKFITTDADGTKDVATFTGEMYWGQPNEAHSFYAYYPYEGYSVEPNNYFYWLEYEQTQDGNSSDHLGIHDFMVATPVKIPAEEIQTGKANVNLSFNHMLSLLEFHIKIDKVVTEPIQVTGITFSCPLKEDEEWYESEPIHACSINLTAKEGDGDYLVFMPMGKNSPIELKVTGNPTQLNTLTDVFTGRMLAVPQDFINKDIVITVKTNKGTCSFTKQGINFERGKVYTTTLTLETGDYTANISNAEDWEQAIGIANSRIGAATFTLVNDVILSSHAHEPKNPLTITGEYALKTNSNWNVVAPLILDCNTEGEFTIASDEVLTINSGKTLICKSLDFGYNYTGQLIINGTFRNLGTVQCYNANNIHYNGGDDCFINEEEAKFYYRPENEKALQAASKDKNCTHIRLWFSAFDNQPLTTSIDATGKFIELRFCKLVIPEDITFTAKGLEVIEYYSNQNTIFSGSGTLNLTGEFKCIIGRNTNDGFWINGGFHLNCAIINNTHNIYNLGTVTYTNKKSTGITEPNWYNNLPILKEQQGIKAPAWGNSIEW